MARNVFTVNIYGLRFIVFRYTPAWLNLRLRIHVQPCPVRSKLKRQLVSYVNTVCKYGKYSSELEPRNVLESLNPTEKKRHHKYKYSLQLFDYVKHAVTAAACWKDLLCRAGLQVLPNALVNLEEALAASCCRAP